MTALPRSLPEFEARFPDEAARARWLLTKRWPDGFRCPARGHDEAWELGRERLADAPARGLRAAGLGDRRDGAPRRPPRPAHLAPVGVADGHPRRRRLGPAAVEAAGPGQPRVGSAAGA